MKTQQTIDSVGLQGAEPIASPSSALAYFRDVLVRGTPRKLASLVRGEVLAALVVSLTFMSFPRDSLRDGLDSSWAAILNYAHEHGLQFGTDVVFTYGPLGFLLTWYYSPAASGLRLLADFLLGFGVALAVCLWLWRLGRLWRWLGICIFTLVLSNLRCGIQDLLIYFGFLAIGLLCHFETRRRLAGYGLALVLLATFASLAKFSLLLTGTLTVISVSASLLLRKQSKAGLGLASGFIVAFCAGWMMLGQKLVNLPRYISSGWEVAKAYPLTMGLDAPGAVLGGAVLTALFTTSVIWLRCGAAFDNEEPNVAWRRASLACWLGLLLFFAWKHGFVRIDGYHIFYLLGFAPLLAVFLTAVQGGNSKSRSLGRGLCALSCLFSVATLQLYLYPYHLRLDAGLANAAYNARTILQPSAYRQKMDQAFESAKYAARLSKLTRTVGTASVDAFGNYQGSAMFNSLNFRPRPALQSYNASSEALMRLDEQFYTSRMAPEYVLFQIGAIDSRFPPLEDARLLRYLLANYSLQGGEGLFLLLKARSFKVPNLTLLREGFVEKNEQIVLSGFNDANLWLEVELQPTKIGILRQILYKPTQTHLAVWRGEPGSSDRQVFRAPAPMLAAGFVASPLLASNADVAALYSGGQVTKPAAYSIELGSNAELFWKPAIHYRLYRIESALGARTYAPLR